ncbi:MAG: response regulator transcription factor [Bacteroidales bacterium]|nr:response regulator transcription factor [Candidatus Latescibacterota bacterium]
MEIRALIVDDEQLARDEMKFLLEGIPGITIAGEAGGGEDAVRMVLELKPDIMFLDIQMPVMDGFQVVRELASAGVMPLVVFTTAYDQYAIKAFEINAIDYLLKPIEKQRLSESIERAREMIPVKDEFLEKVRRLTENIKVGTRFLPRIVLKVGDKVELMEVKKISMLHSEGKGVTAYTAEGKFESNYGTIDEIEVQIDPRLFIRLGVDHLVNINRIKQILPWAGGNYMMTLDDSENTEVRLNRSQAQLLKNKVEGVF